MRKISAEQIQTNWETLMKYIDDYINEDRKPQLLEMYNHFKERMMFAPASGREHFHNAMPGGYVEHVLHIIDFSLQVRDVWKNNGANINFTDEELVFAAMHHDLGKAGDLEHDYYIPNDSEWHRKNQGKIYKANSELQFMTPPDRGLWILNQFNVKFSINEMLGIKLADGMYDDGNIQYLKSYGEDKKIKTNLPMIVHQADMTTTRIEYEQWLHSEEEVVNTKVPKTKDEQQKVDNLKQKFDELFAN